ncbi:hypothetical protein V6N12_047943 [Hibiscus sabdariffa]|uniref:Uncharacterized protein n=1 Tax=Hibiscus sabdariffa TaxID=183260 RepID=A0ABR2CUX1_9ROSI
MGVNVDKSCGSVFQSASFPVLCKDTKSCPVTTVTEERVTNQTNGCTGTSTELRDAGNAVNNVDRGVDDDAELIVSQPIVLIPSSNVENVAVNVDDNVDNARSTNLLVDNGGSAGCDNNVSANTVGNHVHVIDNVSSSSLNNLPSGAECAVSDVSMHLEEIRLVSENAGLLQVNEEPQGNVVPLVNTLMLKA